MRITLSFATTADGYLDDATDRRLMISTPEDWAAVLELRTRCDAILVGAETLRRDNPSLLLRDPQARERRRREGLRPDLTKVTLTRSGRLDPSLKFFTEGDADRVVFAERAIPELDGVATVIQDGGAVTPAFIVTELERRGIRHLLVEGGAAVLEMFLRAGQADVVRRAVNPQLQLGAGQGRTPFRFDPPVGAPCRREQLGGMEVEPWVLHPDTSAEDLHWLRAATDEASRCQPSPTCYCVGAVIRLPDGRVLNVLAEGRLVNLAAGNGHPAEIMDMSFAVQALSLEWMVRHAGMLEKKVYNVPEEIDDQIGRVKLAAMGLSIDTLTQEQKDYLAGWEA